MRVCAKKVKSFILLLHLVYPACAQIEPEGSEISSSIIRGEGTWYGPRRHGRCTASGEIFDTVSQYTAATQSTRIVFGSVFTVYHTDKPGVERSVNVKITDRMASDVPGIIDLSLAAAIKIGLNPRFEDQEYRGSGTVRFVENGNGRLNRDSNCRSHPLPETTWRSHNEDDNALFFEQARSFVYPINSPASVRAQ